jgi:CelD/BcsL family acetyltransferase involved in cellulose biosynthesis
LICEGVFGRHRRWVWCRRNKEPRWLLRIEGRLDDYLKKFSGNTRKCLRRDVRKLENHFHGLVRLCITTAPAQIDAFVENAQKVASKSWQRANVTAEMVARLKQQAGLGWLRCYLLMGDHQPLAYLIGRQADGVYTADESAFDMRVAPFSPGKVLWLKVIEDLHSQGGVRWLDFCANDIGYKQFWATEHCLESSYYLIKRNPRNALAFWPMMALRWPMMISTKLSCSLGLSSEYNRLLLRLLKATKRMRST